MSDLAKLIEEAYSVYIHPSGRVFSIRDRIIFELHLNPRAIIEATLDACNVEDVPGLEATSLTEVVLKRVKSLATPKARGSASAPQPPPGTA